tara:strand:- start:2 stop:376 length:375 start_codon:yes stop_codon:yes gene_type:complete
MKLTKNFSKEEFDSKDGAEMPDEILYNIQKLANQLQFIRDYIGKPIKINSGYRSPEHNASIPGSSKNSQHKLGKAADIVVKGIKPKALVKIIEQLINDGEILQGGLSAYKTFTHYDIRGKKSRW